VYKLCYLILLTISSVKHAVRSPDLRIAILLKKKV